MRHFWEEHTFSAREDGVYLYLPEPLIALGKNTHFYSFSLAELYPALSAEVLLLITGGIQWSADHFFLQRHGSCVRVFL